MSAPLSVTAIMALRKEKLLKFQRQLEERRATLAREVSQATAELLKDEESYADSVDQASAEVDRILALQMTHRDRDGLQKIEEALRRIEAGTFGECESCGEEISEGRMTANPSTTLCIDCKAELESEQTRYPGRVS